MKVFDDAWRRGDLPRGTVATIGNFDGVHRGQQAVISRVVARAREAGLVSLVVTFEPHPLAVLAPERAPLRLTTPEEKIRLLEGCGLDAAAVVHFTPELAATPARDFAESLLFERLDVRELYVGADFSFGRGREGDLDLLAELARGSGRLVTGIEPVEEEGEKVSSTRIREAIAAGEVATAARLLGRPYAVEGTVVHGDGRGRTLGWPTANLECASELLPGFGVYETRLAVEGGQLRPSITNVGLRPTVHDDTRPTVETHVLDFGGDLYGRLVEVFFLDRLRGERRFSSLAELGDQIGRDVAEVRRRLRTDSASMG